MWRRDAQTSARDADEQSRSRSARAWTGGLRLHRGLQSQEPGASLQDAETAVDPPEDAPCLDLLGDLCFDWTLAQGVNSQVVQRATRGSFLGLALSVVVPPDLCCGCQVAQLDARLDLRVTTERPPCCPSARCRSRVRGPARPLWAGCSPPAPGSLGRARDSTARSVESWRRLVGVWEPEPERGSRLRRSWVGAVARWSKVCKRLTRNALPNCILRTPGRVGLDAAVAVGE